MTLEQAILLVMLRLPGPWEAPGAEEPPDARRARIETGAAAIALEVDPPPAAWPFGAVELAGGVVATWFDEGARFALDVHTGARKADKGRSHCFGMVQAGYIVTGAEWRAAVGTDIEATRTCARLTARYLTLHARRCLGPAPKASSWAFAKVVAGYGSGYSCDAKMRHQADLRYFAMERGWRWWRIDRRLEELLPPRSALALN